MPIRFAAQLPLWVVIGGFSYNDLMNAGIFGAAGIMIVRHVLAFLCLVWCLGAYPADKPVPPVTLHAHEGDEKKGKTDQLKQPLPNIGSRLGKPDKQDLASSDGNGGANQEAEWWTDPRTIVLVIGTIVSLLLWRTHRDTARRTLRAYVAVEDIFFVYKWLNAMEGVDGHKERSNKLKVRIKNYGKSPAHRTRVQIGLTTSKPPTNGFRPIEFQYPGDAEQMLHPEQRIGGDRPQTGDFVSSNPGFYVYCRVSYQDVYKRWWVTNACYVFGAEHGRPYDFTPYGDYNREEGHFCKRPA